MITARPNVVKPRSFVIVKSLSTTRFLRRGDRTPPCGQPPTTLAVKLLPIMDVCTSLLSSMDLTHLQQVYTSPRSLTVVIIALKVVLSNSPSMSRKELQRNLFMVQGLFQSMNNMEKSRFSRHT
jgi:hypothetical protein